MLTSSEIEALRLIRSGVRPPHQHELSSLIDKGYVLDNTGSYALTEAGHAQIGISGRFRRCHYRRRFTRGGSRAERTPRQ
jgi:hypothetical protein